MGLTRQKKTPGEECRGFWVARAVSIRHRMPFRWPLTSTTRGVSDKPFRPAGEGHEESPLASGGNERTLSGAAGNRTPVQIDLRAAFYGRSPRMDAGLTASLRATGSRGRDHDRLRSSSFYMPLPEQYRGFPAARDEARPSVPQVTWVWLVIPGYAATRSLA